MIPWQHRGGWRSRSATQERAEDAAVRHATEAKTVVAIYEVVGGYEARPESTGPPKGTNRLVSRARPNQAKAQPVKEGAK